MEYEFAADAGHNCKDAIMNLSIVVFFMGHLVRKFLFLNHFKQHFQNFYTFTKAYQCTIQIQLQWLSYLRQLTHVGVSTRHGLNADHVHTDVSVSKTDPGLVCVWSASNLRSLPGCECLLRACPVFALHPRSSAHTERGRRACCVHWALTLRSPCVHALFTLIFQKISDTKRCVHATWTDSARSWNQRSALYCRYMSVWLHLALDFELIFFHFFIPLHK